MNELEQLKALVDDFCKEADLFIERMKEYDRIQEQNLRLTRQANESWTQVNNLLNKMKHG